MKAPLPAWIINCDCHLDRSFACCAGVEETDLVEEVSGGLCSEAAALETINLVED